MERLVFFFGSLFVGFSYGQQCPQYTPLQKPFPKLLLSTAQADVQALPSLNWTSAYHTPTGQLILAGYHGDWNVCTGWYNPNNGCRVLAKYSGAQFDLQWIRQIDDPLASNISYMDFSQDGTMLATISQESLVLMVFNTSSGDIIRSIKAQPVSGWKHELKSVVIGNSASDTTKPFVFLYSTISNSTLK